MTLKLNLSDDEMRARARVILEAEKAAKTTSELNVVNDLYKLKAQGIHPMRDGNRAQRRARVAEARRKHG